MKINAERPNAERASHRRMVWLFRVPRSEFRVPTWPILLATFGILIAAIAIGFLALLSL